MKTTKTKAMSLVLALILMVTFSVPAYAKTTSQPSGDIHVNFVNTDSVESALNFDGNRADCAAYVYGLSGTTKISVTMLLKKEVSNGTTTVKYWTKTVNSDSLAFDKQWYVDSGNSYELEVISKVTRNGAVETLSVTDYDYC